MKCYIASLVAAASLVVAAEDNVPLGVRSRCNSYRGKAPPKLLFGKKHWIGGENAAAPKLEGKLVWLQFNF